MTEMTKAQRAQRLSELERGILAQAASVALEQEQQTRAQQNEAQQAARRARVESMRQQAAQALAAMLPMFSVRDKLLQAGASIDELHKLAQQIRSTEAKAGEICYQLQVNTGHMAISFLYEAREAAGVPENASANLPEGISTMSKVLWRALCMGYIHEAGVNCGGNFARLDY